MSPYAPQLLLRDDFVPKEMSIHSVINSKVPYKAKRIKAMTVHENGPIFALHFCKNLPTKAKPLGVLQGFCYL